MYFFNGLLFGFILQLSIGPVCFAILHRGINYGFKEAFKMVLGVALVDSIYICISFTGVGILLKIYILKKILLVVGSLVLLVFGIRYFKEANKKYLIEKNVNKDYTYSSKNSFLYAIRLTIVNPITIIFWSGVFGTLILSSELSGFKSIILYSIGCITATIVFLSFVGLLGNLIFKKFNNKILRVFDYIVGIVLIIFSIRMLIY